MRNRTNRFLIYTPTKVFTEALAVNTNVYGLDVDSFLNLLFQKLNTKSGEGNLPSYLPHFPYVNGGLFRDDITCPKFSKKARQILIFLTLPVVVLFFLIITYKELQNLEIQVSKQLVGLSTGDQFIAPSVQTKIGFDKNQSTTIIPSSQSKMNFGGPQSKIYFTEISLEQFYGIEIKDFAHEMANLSQSFRSYQLGRCLFQK